ncbi:exodeoxyribonuclease VII small subunit [Flavobacterium sp. P21]|uniref:exodeoxyribonuclease VII small subunit n=1 Tax=Flavobacterium sp. P21 TaxID=3423948 RepID=UPI003D66B161
MGHFRILEELKRNISRNAMGLVGLYKEKLSSTNQKLASDSRRILFQQNRELSLMAQSTSQISRDLLALKRSDIDYLAGNLKRSAQGYFKTRSLHLEHMQKSIRLMSPQNILKKGYAIVRAGGGITSNTENIKEGDDIEVILHDTILKSTVREKYNMMEEKLTYEVAWSELTAISKEIENETISVDELASKVKRASELIAFCQGRLKATEAEVGKIIDGMENQQKE